MAEGILKSPTNFVEALRMLSGMQNAHSNTTLKGCAQQVFDVQIGRISQGSDFLPAAKTQIADAGVLKSTTNRRDLIVASNTNEDDVIYAASFLQKVVKLYEESGVEEELKKLDIHNLPYGKAREAVYLKLSEKSPGLTAEVFTGSKSEGFSEGKNHAMMQLVESAVQIAYANSVIEAAREKAKVQGLAQTASVDSTKTTQLRVVDATADSKSDPVLGTARAIEDATLARTGSTRP